METKTFGELAINDRFFVYCKSNENDFTLIASNLKESEYKKNHIEVKDDNGDVTDLPCDESRYEDEFYIFTTNKIEYDKWQIPKWKTEIRYKEQRVSALTSEIEELKEKINRADVLAVAPK